MQTCSQDLQIGLRPERKCSSSVHSRNTELWLCFQAILLMQSSCVLSCPCMSEDVVSKFKDCKKGHLGHDVIDIRYKAASVPQCVLVSNACTDKVCICFVVSRCSQICWGKDLQSALTFSCRGDSTEIMLEYQQRCS